MTRRTHRTLPVALTTALLVASTAALADAPIAKDPPLSPRMAKAVKEMAAAFKKAGKTVPAEKIPTRSEVGIPVYPGSWFIMGSPKQGEQLASVLLIVPASPAKVVAFYEKHLHGHTAFFDTTVPMHYIYTGGRPQDFWQMRYPAVWIEPLSCGPTYKANYAKRVCAQGHTRLRIVYDPKTKK